MVTIASTPRLGVEVLDVRHADELQGLLDPRVSEHFHADATPVDLEDMRQHFASMVRWRTAPPSGDSFLSFVLRRLDTCDCVGRLEAGIRGCEAELAFLFVPGVWGQGYAQEAVVWLQSHCRDVYGSERFWATVAPANVGSLKLCRRLGYKEVPESEWPTLASFGAGDVVLCLRA
jgi:[ribosomal protein S5]-alanine N-acetyltransferase